MLEDHYQVTFGERVTLSLFEKILSNQYDESLKKNVITFDLSRIEWIGFVAASLFFSWAAELLTNKRVKINLLHKGQINPQVKKVLLDYQIVGKLNELGADVDCLVADPPSDGIPLRILNNINSLKPTVQEMAKEFGRKAGATELTSDIINMAFQIGIYELAENCFYHGDSKVPHVAISAARSSGAISSFEGLVTVFKKDTPYIEILLGDLGPGIVKKLSQSFPPEYRPPFQRKDRFLKAEAVIAYAFEFASTSDEERRKERIAQLLDSDQIDVKMIGTGLYCVLEVTRLKKGQLIVRTPEGILALDFSNNPSAPIARGKNSLGIKYLAKLKGTHFLLRIPLVIAEDKLKYHQVHIPLKDINVQVVKPFKGLDATNDLPIVIHQALSVVNNSLINDRHYPGITLLMPPSFPLISRAISVFLAGLQAMQAGKRLIIWYNTTATSTLPKDQFTYSTSGDQGCSAIFVGTELSNRFVPYGCIDNLERHWKSRMIDDGGLISFDEETFHRISNQYVEGIREEITTILQGSEVFHEPGPFLIEGQYYTTKYYQISEAIESEFNKGMIAQWCAAHISNDIDILICTELFLKPVAELIVELLQKRGKSIQLLDITSTYEPTPKFTMILSARGKRAIVLTDVICRGDRIKDFLSLLTLIDIAAILTIVDARKERDIGKPLPYQGKSDSTLLCKVISIHKDSITIHKDPPIHERHQHGKKELVFIIDRQTKSPTLYVRPSEPCVKFNDIPKGPILHSEALFAGHYEHYRKHYSYFFHIPRLLALWRSNVEEWLNEQVQFVLDLEPPDKPQPWNACIYSPQSSLDWLESSLINLPVKFSTIKFPIIEQLLAPEPPTKTSAKGNWLIVLPAIASGETARLFIEYVSRKNPGNILLLCFLSRMDPYHQSFLTGIKRYWDAQLRVAFYLEFPIKSYQPSTEPCPMCSENILLEGWLELLKRLDISNESPLLEALGSKISANKPLVLEYKGGDLSMAIPSSKHSIDRAHVRSLYELSEYDLDARRQLNSILTDCKWIDRFLEVLSAERLSHIFNTEMLNIRLYKSFPSVKERLQYILAEMNPPFPIGRYVGAMVHLIPHSFIGTAVDLICRFAESKRDIEEICVGLLFVNATPALTSDIYAKARDIGDHSVGTLFHETLELLKYASDRDRRHYDKSAKLFSALHTRLTRSDEFSLNVKSIKLTLEKGNYKPTEIITIVKRIAIGWIKISELINTLHSTSVWPRLMERHPEIGQIVGALDKYMAHLHQLLKTPVSEGVISQINSTCLGIHRSMSDLLESVKSLFINPALCDANQLPDEIIASDGSKLLLTRKIDYDIPLTFCDFDDLNQVVNELTANWEKHKKIGKSGSNVIFKIYPKNAYVCMEFGDDIEGDFNLSSEGGLKIVREFCDAYGCAIDIKKDPKTNTKSLIILLCTGKEN